MTNHTRTRAAFLIFVLLLLPAALDITRGQTPSPSLTASSQSYEQLKSEAEKLYAAGSYALARDVYAQVDPKQLPPEAMRWLEFRLADTQWRAQAASANADTTKLDEARRRLEALLRDRERVEDHDTVWAEAHESLGDLFWTRREARDWAQAWPHYQAALDWWAGATRDLDAARFRYLKLVWTMADPPARDEYYYYGYYGNTLPREVLENVLKIARRDEDRARAHYLLAMTARAQGGGDAEQRARVPEEFEAALKPGKQTDWYDDALFNYAEWMNSFGNSGKNIQALQGPFRWTARTARHRNRARRA